MNATLRLISIVASLLATPLAFAAPDLTATQPSEATIERKAAIFALTRDPKIGKQQVKMLEDMIAARVARTGFHTLTRDMIVDSLSNSMKHPGAVGTPPKEKEFIFKLIDAWKGTGEVEKSVEQQLDEQSSIMRLAQTIGADLIVVAIAESFGTEKIEFKGNELAPIAATTIKNNLLVTYRLAFAASGGSVAGDSVRVTRSWRESESLRRETNDLLNSMFEEVAAQLSDKISAANQSVKEVPKVQATGVDFNIKAVLPGGVPLQLPVYENGDIKLPVSATVAADVMMDGVSVGTVPGELRLATGLHQITIQAAGFKPWKRFINVSSGQKFDVLLEMTPEGYAKWKEIISFLSDFSKKTKLTNAEVKQMEAKAEAMRKAGLIVTVGGKGLDVIRQ